MLVVSGRATSTLCTGFVDPSHEVSVGLSCCKFCTGELSYPPLRNALACMNGPVAASSAIDLSCVCGYCGKSTAGVGGSCVLTSSEGKSSCSLCIPMKLGKAGASNHQPTKYPGDNLPVFWSMAGCKRVLGKYGLYSHLHHSHQQQQQQQQSSS